MELHHRTWTAHTIGNVGCGLTSPPFDSTHGRTTSGVPCHHRPWTARTNGRCRLLHDITSLGHRTRSNDVVCGMTSPPLDDTHGQTTSALGRQTRLNDVRRDMPSLHLGSTHGRTTSGLACHHRLWAPLRSNDVGRGMPSLPLGTTPGLTTAGLACHHHLWASQTVERRRAWHEITVLELHARSDDVGSGMTSPPFDSTHGRTTSGMA
uniref:Uncharacterized protein n=1 Tax=Solanum lycopersicum TaxID=4081 RepID=A0A494G8M7_SOLLC